jgi:hypothetical protein
MSSDSKPNHGVDKGRLLITGTLLLLIIFCVIHIIWLLQPTAVGTRIPAGGPIMVDFGFIELLSLSILAVWVLRRPPVGVGYFFARWAGKALLFVGVGLALFIFLFATCFFVVSNNI